MLSYLEQRARRCCLLALRQWQTRVKRKDPIQKRSLTRRENETSLTYAYIVDNVAEVEFTGNSSSGRLVLADGVLSDFIVVGTDRSSSLARYDMIMRINRAGRGIYYTVEPIGGTYPRLRLRQANFDDLQQSPNMLQRRMRQFELIAGSHSTASREELKAYWHRIMGLERGG